MSKNIIPAKAWAVVRPNGRIVWHCVADTKGSAEFDMQFEVPSIMTIADAYAAGWRVVRVTIAPALGIGAAAKRVRSKAKDGTRAKPGASRATPKKKKS